MNKTFKLTSENIRGERFKNVIDICFKYSTFFSLTTNFDAIENSFSKKLVNDLNYFLLKNFKTDHWHCYYILDKSKPLNISIYKSNEKTKQILIDSCNNIYLEIDKGGFIAEDICFFSNNELLLGTVSHANICHIYPSSENILKSFLNLEHISWKEVDYLESEHIKLII